MKTYEAIFNSNNTDGVFGISLVEDPAMEGLFITLSKQDKIQLAEVNKEERILMGLVLEPNKLVYRNQGGEEFNMVFKEETIKNLAHNFFKQGYQRNSTIEHSKEDKIPNVSFVESWIVEDPKNDKSNVYGFSYPKGTWMASMKVDNDEIWNEYVKTGKVQGFSIDAMVDLQEINLKSSIKMAEEQEKDVFADLKVWFTKNFLKKEEVKFGTVKTSDGNIDIYFDGEEIMQGAAVWSQTEDGERLPLPMGDYETEMGVVVVSEDSTVTEVKQKEQQEMAEEQAPEAKPEASNDDLTNQIKSLLIKYSEDTDKKIEEIKTEFSKQTEDLKKENEELKKEVVELSNTEIRKPVKTASPVEFSKMTELEKRRYYRANEK